jgi:hypothetical protein
LTLNKVLKAWSSSLKMKPFTLNYILAQFGLNKRKNVHYKKKLLTNFLSNFRFRFAKVLNILKTLQDVVTLRRETNPTGKINYMLLNKPTISLPSNMNIVSVMFTGVRQYSLEKGDLNWLL